MAKDWGNPLPADIDSVIPDSPTTGLSESTYDPNDGKTGNKIDVPSTGYTQEIYNQRTSSTDPEIFSGTIINYDASTLNARVQTSYGEVLDATVASPTLATPIVGTQVSITKTYSGDNFIIANSYQDGLVPFEILSFSEGEIWGESYSGCRGLISYDEAIFGPQVVGAQGYAYYNTLEQQLYAVALPFEAAYGAVVAIVETSSNADFISIDSALNIITGQVSALTQAINDDNIYFLQGERVLIGFIGGSAEILGVVSAYSKFKAVTLERNQGDSSATLDCTIKGITIPVLFLAGEFSTLNVEIDDEVYISFYSDDGHLRSPICDTNVSDQPIGSYRPINGLVANRGWHICDGTDGTLDLRKRVVAGYDVSDGDYDAIGETGGSKTHTHDDHPNHRHAFDALSPTIAVTTPGDSSGTAIDGAAPGAIWTSGVSNLPAETDNILEHEEADGRDPYITLNWEVRVDL